MPMDSPELQDYKDYLRVDSDDEDYQIEGFVLAAKGYLLNAGVKDNAHGELYDVVVKMLVALFYEHRDTADKQINIPPIMNNLITQLSIVSLKSEGVSP
ncbi:head-tail connector protein [Cohnella herbarum]|uniref:Phage gp6-like head-tail connector protein n=1 Tax=Cohnella herbarum TaxID=2728023 RepID=A0A7Z2VRD6_9BACL|nr:head-tail connector protein [Cohnella herbarum]QJD87897.1 phage gp6-like head-tail connector protein [Cohnella herbarum]